MTGTSSSTSSGNGASTSSAAGKSANGRNPGAAGDLGFDLEETELPEQPAGWRSITPPDRKRRNMHALCAYLAAQPIWWDYLRFNELTQEIEVRTPFPPRTDHIGGGPWRPLTDADVIRMIMWCQHEAGLHWVRKGVVNDALSLLTQLLPHHPIHAWLGRLPQIEPRPQGVEYPHADRLLIDYFPVKMTAATEPYVRAVGRKVLVSLIKRTFEPGCKLDHMVVLEGDQRFGKSLGLRRLMADERWFMEDLSLRLVDDDTKRTLCGKWLVEMAEFPHLKNEAEVFKAFVSGQTDRYREKFGIRSADHPRQCVFAGTTNRLEFVDDTGNTRMWPVQCCGPIDFDRIERDRDWLFAEALAAYHAGERVWLSDNVEPVARRQQDKFLPDDAWSVPVQRWINHRLVPVAPMTMHEVMVGIGLEQLSQQNNSAQVRVGKILRSLGWEPGEKETIDGERVRRWRQVKLIS